MSTNYNSAKKTIFLTTAALLISAGIGYYFYSKANAQDEKVKNENLKEKLLKSKDSELLNLKKDKIWDQLHLSE